MADTEETRRACDVGLAGPNLMVQAPCPRCGVVRWKRISDRDKLCIACAAATRAREDRPITFFGDRIPQVGDTATARSIGLTGDQFMFYDPCAKCGKLRWVRKYNRGTYCQRCAPRSNKPRSDRSADGRYVSSGYFIVRIEKSDPLFTMAKSGGWILEHRLVLARQVGRPLARNEVAHHINGDRLDNRESNLQLLTRETHHSLLVGKSKQQRIRDLEKQIMLLEAENLLLRARLTDIANPEPSRGGNSLGACRDLTGDTLLRAKRG